MEKKVARILSFVFHPLLMPTYGVLLFLYLQAMTGIVMPYKAGLLLIVFIFLMTFAIPLSLSLLMLRIKLVNSLEMHTRNERIIPLFITAILFYITYYSLKKTSLFIDLQLFILGSTVLILITICINYFTKISIHMIGIGGVAGALLALSLSHNIVIIHFLIFVIFVAGLLGFSRLKLDAHKEFQIYLGFLTGVIIMALMFLFL